MYNEAMAYAEFEAKKNKKALLYTAIICAILILLAILITWPILQPPVPVVQDLIEINLGNDAEGAGTVQPLIKGEMSPSQEAVETNRRVSSSAQNAPSKDIQPDDNTNKDAASIDRPEKTSPKATNVSKSASTKIVKSSLQPTVNPTPKPQKPKITYNGPGNGKGNGATQDNTFRYQGNKPGGNGDAGTSTGKADSYGPDANGKTGVSISRGLNGRKFTHLPSFQEDFNEDAKVYVDISLDANGNVTSADIARGTTTTNGNIRAIALQKAKQLKFNAGEEDNGTIIFHFKVHD